MPTKVLMVSRIKPTAIVDTDLHGLSEYMEQHAASDRRGLEAENLVPWAQLVEQWSPWGGNRITARGIDKVLYS